MLAARVGTSWVKTAIIIWLPKRGRKAWPFGTDEEAERFRRQRPARLNGLWLTRPLTICVKLVSQPIEAGFADRRTVISTLRAEGEKWAQGTAGRKRSEKLPDAGGAICTGEARNKAEFMRGSDDKMCSFDEDAHDYFDNWRISALNHGRRCVRMAQTSIMRSFRWGEQRSHAGDLKIFPV